MCLKKLKDWMNKFNDWLEDKNEEVYGKIDDIKTTQLGVVLPKNKEELKCQKEDLKEVKTNMSEQTKE